MSRSLPDNHLHLRNGLRVFRASPADDRRSDRRNSVSVPASQLRLIGSGSIARLRLVHLLPNRRRMCNECCDTPTGDRICLSL
jgi:hypothetical protein